MQRCGGKQRERIVVIHHISLRLLCHFKTEAKSVVVFKRAAIVHELIKYPFSSIICDKSLSFCGN